MEKQASYEIFFVSHLQHELSIWITENMMYLQSSKQHDQHLPVLSHLRGRVGGKGTALGMTQFLNSIFDKFTLAKCRLWACQTCCGGYC